MQTQNYGNDESGTTGTGRTSADSHAKLDQAASKAHATVDRVHRKATQVSDRVTSQGEVLMQDACAWVTAHPIQALAGAFFAGYLFGKIRS